MYLKIVEKSGLLDGKHVADYYVDPIVIYQPLAYKTLQSLFVFIMYCFLLCISVTCIEMLYENDLDRKSVV